MNVKFNEVVLSKDAKSLINECLLSGHFQSDGIYSKKVLDYFYSHMSIRKMVLTTSCSHALESALWLYEISGGDEVILPSYNFPSAPNAVLLHRGQIKFCDISLDTLCLDENDMLNRIGPKTKVLIPMHYGGISCDMDMLAKEKCEIDKWVIVEDSAQGAFSRYKGRYLGTIGNIGCYSFHGTKNIQGGEGGALIVNDPNIDFDRVQSMVQKGTNRHQFLSGDTSYYTWMHPGSSYTPSDLLMALLYSQLLEREAFSMTRRQSYDRYENQLAPFVGYKGLEKMIQIPDYNESNYHMFYVRFESMKLRNQIMDSLAIKGIDSRFHFMALHNTPMGYRLGYKAADFPNSQKASETILRLPLHNHMTIDEVDYVCESLVDILKEL
ncbi:MAG: dTDP-4-amino-4,6-dideoxygalactose transaminase [Eubacteriales bacterium]|nr:dTDP-4-amino-4,6-dideoxygalactose transaminase [Eubacteriales bacterium]